MSSKPIEVLGGRSAQLFLAEYWQKKPLLIRNALPGVENLLEPEEMAGLALEDAVESRIILERSPVDWELRHGPFTDKTFNNLPPTHWTLLIQALDHLVPAVADILEQFDFLPNWRIDDIMGSFAPRGGSVGPHFDYYDVFLVQAHGQRRWQLGQQCDENTPIIGGLPVKILEAFDPTQEWVLNPGDILYLPPGLAHYGVAENDCMTFSVGFRAPSEQEIFNEFAHFISQHHQQDRRLEDPDLAPQSNPGWITPEAIDKVAGILQKMASDKTQIGAWMGEFFSQTKYDQQPEPPEGEYNEAEVHDLLTQQLSLRKEESSRFIYTGEAHRPHHFFVNGVGLDIPPLSQSMVLYLCKHRHYSPATLSLFCESPENMNLILKLLNMGVIYFEDEFYQA
ncbi:MAG: cupin domain-containing protein [Pseudomonadales bacterium]|nr:cupin domain-containing protein [Pseudomonadales bacterium]